MRYLSICSGIEAATVACHHLSWQAVAFSEIDPFPCAVLAHHYPDVPNIGNMATIDGSKYRETVDLIVGGTPCQSFSVAGKRGGMADPRGQLAHKFVDLVRDVSPRWVIWENVPGILSSGGGTDFKAFATALVECGYHVAWRVLDAQHFGVPQRRRRVFLVGYFGDWRPAAAVLFEPHSLCGNIAAGRKTKKDVAGIVDASLARSRRAGQNNSCITQALTGRLGGGGPDDNKAQGGFYIPKIVGQNILCVRRLNPLECERLQGFPDNYTAITYRGKPAADSPRYKAIGNSMAVPVVRWLFERIERHSPSKTS